MNKRVNQKLQSWLQMLLLVVVVVLVNILANMRIGGLSLYKKWDLTEEKRFTLSEGTKQTLQSANDVIDVKILLDGTFPAGFKRLQKATIEILDDFKSETGYLEYYFENPTPDGISVEEINNRREQLRKDNILPIRLNVEDTDGRSEQYIYPYAILSYKGRSLPVNLLENQQIATPEASEMALNNSVALLEYKLANAIQKLQTAKKPIVVFTTGHGELPPIETASLEYQLRKYYDTGRINLDSMVVISEAASVLVVAKPTRPFSDRDKFKIDQYIMNGGKVLFLLDHLNVSMDSLRKRSTFLAMPQETQLDDLLFKYGVRLGSNLVLDMQHSPIPLQTGIQGGKPQMERFGYPYHLVVTNGANHPIVQRLGPINMQFVSTIDTTVKVKTPLEKTVLLASTPNSRLQFAPITMDFEFLRYDLEVEKFNAGPQPLAVLLEGTFPSLYTNRIAGSMAKGLEEMDLTFRETSISTKIVVIADGDVARNPVNPVKKIPEPLGLNPYDKFMYSNADLLLNTIEYLLDQNGTIEARGKDVKLRLLNESKANAERTKWQLINIGVPVLLLGLFGWFFNRWRYNQYAKPTS